MTKTLTAAFVINVLSLANVTAQTVPPSCTGDNNMLAIIDRPSVGYSPCTVGNKILYIESGYSYQILTPSAYGHNLPQTEMRFGIMNNTEIEFFPPNYFEQSNPSQSALSATTLGLKHVFYFDSHQMITGQGYVTPPSGNQYFGTTNTSFIINGIYGYNFDSGFSFVTTLGVAANAAPIANPAKNYYTFNPIIDLGLPITEKIAAYLEVYSQSKTALDQGWGVSMDGGLIFLAEKNLTFDVSAGQRMSGYLGGMDHYFGAGFVIALGL